MRGPATAEEARSSLAVGTTPERDELVKRFALHRLAFQQNLPQIFSSIVEGSGSFVMDEKCGLTVADHLLITATLAERDGATEETIVCALLHDVGVFFAPDEHAALTASLLRPFLSEGNHWLIEHHALANRVYMSPPDLSINRFKDHPHFGALMRFAAYDVNGYKPQPHEPWSHFRPLLDSFFSSAIRRRAQ